MPIKFNDTFQFPLDLDMSPYTLDYARAKECGVATTPQQYKLAGVLVHSGQASGGHYYSYARQRDSNGQLLDHTKWLKFDDSEVYNR